MSVTETIQKKLPEPVASAVKGGSRLLARRGTGWTRPAVAGPVAIGAMVAIGAGLAYYNARRARREMAGPALGRSMSSSMSLDDVKAFGAHKTGTVASAINSNAEWMRAIAGEATKYSRQSFEDSSVYFGKLLRAQKLDDLIELQSDFLKGAYGHFLAHAFTLAELYSNMAIKAFPSFVGASEGSVKAPR